MNMKQVNESFCKYIHPAFRNANLNYFQGKRSYQRNQSQCEVIREKEIKILKTEEQCRIWYD